MADDNVEDTADDMADETTGGMAADTAESDDLVLVSALATDDVVTEASGPSLIARVGAEVAGTFILVFLGVGMGLLLRVTGNSPLVAGLGFGLGVMIAIVAFGRVSGAHLNPAVTVGAWLAGRFPGLDVVPYILGQMVGGILAGLLLHTDIASLEGITSSQVTSLMGTAAIGYADHAPYAASGLTWNLGVAFGAELIATAIFVLVVLSATARKANAAIAPLVIGLAFATVVTFTIPFTNGGVNPARATATALFANDWALTQLWAWWLAPIIGAAVVGLVFRIFGPAEDLVAVAGAVEDVD